MSHEVWLRIKRKKIHENEYARAAHEGNEKEKHHVGAYLKTSSNINAMEKKKNLEFFFF